MKKFIVVMIMIVCILFIANASWVEWYGWVHYPDGTNAPKGTIITCVYVNTDELWTSYTGSGYCLSENNGMIPGKEYLRVEARANGHYGFAPGGVYKPNIWVEKNIILNDVSPK